MLAARAAQLKRLASGALPVFMVGAPLLVRACHRLDPPVSLSQEQREAVLRVARAALEAAARDTSSARVNERDEPSLQSISVQSPVIVTVYGPDAALRREPRVGLWEPNENTMGLPLREAIVQAATSAGKLAHDVKNGAPQTEGTLIKVDILGPSRRAWLAASWFLDFVSDPGRDGFRADRDNHHAFFLPSWTVERSASTPKTLSYLANKLGEPVGGPSIHRFQTTSIVEGPVAKPGAHEVFRGNVLLPELNETVVREGLDLAGKYLARSIGQDGRFCYNYLALEDRCDNDYNLLRHAGTAYSLFQIYAEIRDPVMLAAAERSMAWLRKQTRQVDGDPSRVFLLEGDRAKLGAVGLSLLAFVEREKIVADGKDRELMTKLANYLLSQQREDGYFASFFAWKAGVEAPRENSIYYPGEALLGLVRLYSIDPQPKWLTAANKAATYLVKKRWRFAGIELYVPPDAWLTQALAELDAIAPATWLRDYAYSLVGVTEMSMLRAEEGAARDFDGGPGSGFGFPGVTPAGSRNEGTTAVWKMAKRRQEPAQIARLRSIALRSARFQLNQEIRPENSWFFPEPSRVMGGFRGTAIESEVRIDYVQHNCTGLLGVLAMLRDAS
ncbi:MAG: hypothetical protein U0165_16580 [Polyangiaceae bacterium]